MKRTSHSNQKLHTLVVKVGCCVKIVVVQKIVLNNSAFLVQTDAAMTGVDLFVPELDGEGGNNSAIVFYGNGRCVDNVFAVT